MKIKNVQILEISIFLFLSVEMLSESVIDREIRRHTVGSFQRNQFKENIEFLHSFQKCKMSEIGPL